MVHIKRRVILEAGIAWRNSPPLIAVTLIMLAAFGASCAAMVLDPRTISGAPAWLSGILCRHTAAVNRHVAGPDQHG